MVPEATYAPDLIRVTVMDQDPAVAEARLTEIVDRILVEHRRSYEDKQRVHGEYIELLRAQTASWEELAGVLFKRAIRRLAPGPQSKESSPDTIVSVPLSDQRDDQSFIDTKILDPPEPHQPAGNPGRGRRPARSRGPRTRRAATAHGMWLLARPPSALNGRLLEASLVRSPTPCTSQEHDHPVAPSDPPDPAGASR